METKNKSSNSLNKSSWIKHRHFLSIFFKFFLTFSILIGSIISIFFSVNYFIGKNNNNAEFGNTYNIKYELDLSVNLDNKNLSGNENNSYESSLNRLKKTADSFDEWLFYKKIYNNGVQYSIKEIPPLNENENSTYKGWIFTNLYNINDVSYIQFDDVKQDPMRVLNDKTTNNFIEIIPYDKNKVTSTNPKSNEVLLNSLGLDVQNSKISKYDETIYNNNLDNNSSLETSGVEFKFFSPINIEEFMNYKAGLNNPINDSANYKWFVFNDLDKLIQRLNYVKSVCYWNNEKNHQKYFEYGNANLLPLTLYDPSVYSLTNPNGVQNLNHINYLYESLTTEEKTWGDISSSSSDAELAVTKENILDFYNQFDSSNPLSPIDKTTGNFDSSIQPLIQKNIIGEITSSNYHEWFPQAYELSSVVEEVNLVNRNIESKLPQPGQIVGPKEVQIFKIPINNENNNLPNFLFPNLANKNANEMQTFFKKYSSYSPIVSFNKKSIIPNNTEPIVFFGTGDIGPPLIKNSITGLSAYNSIFLASGIILLTIAIIVSIIYRVPGLVASLAVIFTTTTTFAFSGLLGLTFSFGSFLAIIIGSILTLFSSIIFLERIRKNIIESKSIFDASKISIRKSIGTIIDIHFISIIIGLSVALIGTLEMIDFGFELILTSLVSFISTFVVFLFVQFNFSKLKLFWNSKLYFFNIDKKIKNKDINEKKFIEKIDAPFKLSKWVFLSLFIFFIILIIISITLLFTIGILNSVDLKKGTSIYIYQNVDVNQIIKLIGGNWVIKINTDNFIWIQSPNFFSQSNISELISSMNIDPSNLFVSESTINIAPQIAKTNTLALLAGSGFIAIYSFIRLGVFSVIPIFTSTILVTLFAASFQYIIYLPIDNYFIYSMAFIFLLNNILSIIFISIIKSRFNKRKIFNRNEIKLFLQKNIMNLSHLWLSLILIIPTSIAISMIFISTTLFWAFFSILISLIISVPLILLFTSYLYYEILLFRQKYVKNIIFDNISNTAYKFDSIDEQIIEGINYRG